MSDVKNEAGEILKGGCIVVDDQKRVLLVVDKAHQVWAYPKGHCDPGETPEATALRETREETGYEVAITKRLPDLTYISGETQEPIRVAMFLATPGRRIAGKTDERTEWRPLAEAKELVLDNLKPYLDELI